MKNNKSYFCIECGKERVALPYFRCQKCTEILKQSEKQMNKIIKIIIVVAIIGFLVWLFHDGISTNCDIITKGPYAGMNECDVPEEYFGPF